MLCFDKLSGVYNNQKHFKILLFCGSISLSAFALRSSPLTFEIQDRFAFAGVHQKYIVSN